MSRFLQLFNLRSLNDTSSKIQSNYNDHLRGNSYGTGHKQLPQTSSLSRSHLLPFNKLQVVVLGAVQAPQDIKRILAKGRRTRAPSCASPRPSQPSPTSSAPSKRHRLSDTSEAQPRKRLSKAPTLANVEVLLSRLGNSKRLEKIDKTKLGCTSLI